MKGKLSDLFALAACVLLLLAACTSSGEVPIQKATMSADSLRAGALAYEAFASKIRDPRAENDFQKFAASPENYDVLFLENDEAYYFAFRIRRYRGRLVLDGGLTFRVDKSSGKVSIAKFPEPASSILSKATTP